MTNQLIKPLTDIYDDLKLRDKEKIRIAQAIEFAYTTLLEMFTYEGLPDTLPSRELEKQLLRYGQAFIGKIGGDLVCCRGTLAGELDPYGYGTEVVATTLNGKEMQGKRDSDIVWCRNNDIISGETFVYWYAHMLNEIDLSIDLNVKYARLLPVPIVRDSKTKKAFDETVNKIMDGDISAVLSDNILNKELSISEQVLNLSDVNKIDKVQYLSRLRDDINKIFYNRYGQALQTQNKAAQQTTDEVHGMDSASFIIPYNMLKNRKEFIEKVNEIFDTDITVDFSESWKYETEKYKQDIETMLSETNETNETNETDETNETNETDETNETNENKEGDEK